MPITDHRVWLSNIESKHIKQIMKDSLVRDIWLAWSRIYFEIPETREDIKSQLTWGNSLVLRAARPFFDKNLINSNIERIESYFNQGQFRRFENLQDYEKGNVPLLLFNSLKAAIPPVWRNHMKNIEQLSNPPPSPPQTKWEHFESLKSPSKYFYWCMIEKVKPTQTAQIKWQTELNCEINDWELLFINIFKVTNATKLREFHYKIINQILVTNVTRSKYDTVSPTMLILSR